MYAIHVEGDDLVWRETDGLSCGPGQVRIRVAASAVNRADLVQRQGGYPPPPGASPILGLECAGEVLEIGEGVQRVSVGDAVCALLAGGGYAAEVVVPAGQVLPIPRGFSFAQAAAVPEVFATAYLNLYMEAALKPGERVVLHAGASGVGTAAIQMLKHSDNPVFVTAGSQAKVNACIDLGAEAGSDRHTGSFLEAVRGWAPDGVDVILDPVGAGYLADNLQALGLGGRLVIIGLMGGVEAPVNLAALMMKRMRVIGSTLRARPISEKAAVMDALYQNIWPQLESGAIVPVVDSEFAIADAASAHARIATNETVGKVILNMP